ncbi:oligosaccharide flippase family protein [Treponema sp. OMZ 305]|jgi:polysaccharide biosynthesis protein|uniref:oligosaccharide flippase family protein n=1 Tax=unclassified Treponema TaxID=2638727 RepID=UPI0020A3137E|nr:oligosaccharide flippase family protein [Treponema sp. OMZ 305]UTC58669.1 oligosaccharide flippase family protein [Treponema sp. OMZ 305]
MVDVFSKNKSISRVVIFNVFGSFVLQGISFFTAPIFTRLLSPSDYGIVAVYTAWQGLFMLFIGLQTYGSIANARITYEKNTIDMYLSAIMTLSFLSFACVLSICIIWVRPLSRILGIQQGFVILLPIHSFCVFIVNFYTTKWMQFKDVEKNAIFGVLIAVVSVCLSLIFIYFFQEEKYRGKIYGAAIPQILSACIFLVFLYRNGRCFYNKDYWQYCLKLTLPLILHGAGGLILSQSDRIMLKKFVGEESVGIYSVGYSLALIISSIWGALNTSWVPFYYEYKKDNNRNLILEKAGRYMTLFSVLTMGFLLLAPEVYKIMAPSAYWKGIRLIPLIVLAYYFNFLYAFPANHEFFYQKTIYISLGTLVAAGINIGLNFLLIPIYGDMGAAIATVVSFVFLFLFHDIIARYVIKNLEYHFRFYLCGLVPVLCVAILYYFTLSFWYIRWAVATCLGVFLLLRIIKQRALF